MIVEKAFHDIEISTLNIKRCQTITGRATGITTGSITTGSITTGSITTGSITTGSITTGRATGSVTATGITTCSIANTSIVRTSTTRCSTSERKLCFTTREISTHRTISCSRISQRKGLKTR